MDAKTGKTARKKQKQRRNGVSIADEAKQRSKLRGNDAMGRELPSTECYLPSESWVDVHFGDAAGVDDQGHPVRVRTFDLATPKSPLNHTARAAEVSEMVHCSICGRLCPENATAAGACMDHQPDHYQMAFGPSPSGQAIQTLERMNLWLDRSRIRLKSEDEADLLEEIRLEVHGQVRAARFMAEMKSREVMKLRAQIRREIRQLGKKRSAYAETGRTA